MEFKVKYDDVLDFKKRRYVRSMVSSALRKGLLIKSNCCASCNLETLDLQAHHVDYGKPLDVIWLCTKCHGRAHRKNSRLNPNNNKQSPMNFLQNDKKFVTVTFTIPIENFIALKEKAKKKDQSISKIMRKFVLEEFPIQSNQLEFNFMENVNDKSLQIAKQGISCLAENENDLFEPKSPLLSSIRRERNNRIIGMDELHEIFRGYGRDAEKLQRHCINR